MLVELLENLPSTFAKFYEDIYVVNKKNDECDRIEYLGTKVKVNKKGKYVDFTDYLNNYNDNIVNNIESNDTYKNIYKNKKGESKLIESTTNGDYKIVFIMDVTIKQSESADKYTLLIADDSPVITKFFTRLFESEFDIITAHDGNEAIDLVNKNIDKKLVGCFFDLQMPNKNGYEVLDYFKEQNLFKRVPVSVISGEDSGSAIESLIASYPIVDMIQKPFSKETAGSIVSKTINQSPIYKK